MGAHRLKAVVLTHYHADHTSGLELLLERVEVERLYLPSLEDEYGVKDKICAIAAQKGIETVFVEDVESLTLGGATLRVYPARGEEEPERGGADGPVLGGELRCARDGRHARKYREEAHRGL